jgi:hypothetical protein
LLICVKGPCVSVGLTIGLTHAVGGWIREHQPRFVSGAALGIYRTFSPVPPQMAPEHRLSTDRYTVTVRRHRCQRLTQLQPSAGIMAVGFPTDTPRKRGVVPLSPMPVPRATQPLIIRLANNAGEQGRPQTLVVGQEKNWQRVGGSISGHKAIGITQKPGSNHVDP